MQKVGESAGMIWERVGDVFSEIRMIFKDWSG